MKISLKFKFFLSVLVAILLSIGISSYIYYKNFYDEYLKNSYNITQNDLDIVKANIFHHSDQIKQLIKQIANYEELQDGLNFISSYQDKKQYDKNIFDKRKLELLEKLALQVQSMTNYSFGVFDKNGELVLFDRLRHNKKLKGIVTFENQKPYLYDPKSNKTIKVPSYKAIKDDKLNQLMMFLEKQGFAIKFVKKIYFNSKHVGYLRIKQTFTKDNINLLLKATKHKFSFIAGNSVLGTLYDIDKDLIKKKAIAFKQKQNNYNEMIENKKYFIHSNYIELREKRLYLVASHEKKYFNDKIKALTKQFLFIVIISILIAFIFSSIFLKINVINPLDKLMDGIRRLKNKDYSSIKLQSNDELKEIANEYNILTKSLKQSFAEIEESREFLEKLIDNVPIRIFWKDKNSIYLWANNLFLSDVGLDSVNELIGKSDFDLPWNKEYAKKYVKDDSEVIKSGIPKLHFEEMQVDSMGMKKHLITSKVPLKDKKRNIIGVLGTYEDVTEKRNIENELKTKEKLLYEQTKLASMGEMIGNIAHQWRQPLSIISTGATGMMMQKKIDKLDDKFLYEVCETINTNAQYLSRTIDDFKNFIKGNTKKEIFVLEEIINSFINLVDGSIKNHNINIILDLQKDLKINGVSNQLIQCFINIFNNAKDAMLNCEKEKYFFIKTYIQNEKVVISLRDSGGGIPQKIISRVFEPYFTTKYKSQGTGLGLHMTYNLIVDGMDGNIEVKNVDYTYKNIEHKGAEFIITLPL